MTSDPGIDDLAGRLASARAKGRTLVTGLTGAVSAGKSTLAQRLADRLTALGLSVEVISTGPIAAAARAESMAGVS